MGFPDELRDTLKGRKVPDLSGVDATVFLHTVTCIYALDSEGVCRYAIEPDGNPLPKLDRCVGAQYAASFQPNSPHGLIADPKPGTHALFIGKGSGTRMALIKTPPLIRVVFAEDTPEESKEDLAWVDEQVQKSWLRSTQVGNPAMVETAIAAMKEKKDAIPKPLVPPRPRKG